MNPTANPWAAAPAEVQECVQRLRELVPHLIARLRPSVPLDASGFDSLEVVEFLCAVESACGVRLAIEDADPRTTAAELLALIARRSPQPALPVLP